MTTEHKKRKRNLYIGKVLLRSLPLLVMLCMGLMIIFSGEEITAQEIAQWTPDSYPLAIGFFLLAYVLKTLSLVFPLLALFIAAGMVFPTWLALLVNFSGLALSMIIGYYAGLAAGSAYEDKLMANHPRLQELKRIRQSSDFLFSYTIRALGIFSCDLVSMYMGATRAPLVPFICGSLLGFAPGVVAQTLVGTTINDPSSPLFWAALAGAVLVALGSFLFYYHYIKKKNALRHAGDHCEEKKMENL